MQPIWNRYFANEHEAVLTETNAALTTVNAADLLHVSGLSLLALEKVGEAVPRLRASIALAPHLHYFANAAISTLNAQAPVEALEFAKDGLRFYPTDPTLHFSAANALMASGRLDEAMAEYEETLKLKPDMDDARMNMGNCYRRKNLPELALTCYDDVLTRQPGNGGVIINRIGTLMEMREYGPAGELLEQILPQADIPEVSFMLAMIRLAEGDYERGWALYRRRWDCGMAAADRKLMLKPILASLADAHDKHVLMIHEQGFGDSLQFVRYAPMMLAHAGRVSVLVPQSLLRLFQRIDDRVNWITDRSQAGDYDYEVPLIENPYLFGTRVETIPNAIPYLTVPNDMIEAAAFPPSDKIRVGLVWAGQMRPNPDLAAVDRRRSLSLDALLPLAGVPGVEFISLQLGEPAEQIHANDDDWLGRITEVLEPGFDFLDTAAIIKNLDLVITVDTAVAHLAAALGVQTWILSRYDGCWRWLENRQDSPWYPGVVRLFQQTKRLEWGGRNGPIEKLTAALDSFSRRAAAGRQ